MTEIVISAMGIRAGGADNLAQFSANLRAGVCATHLAQDTWHLALPEGARSSLRNASIASRLACTVAWEAWTAAALENYAHPEDVAVIVAGNNIQQAYIADHFTRYLKSPAYVSPRYAATYYDTSLVGAVSELVGARGFGFSAGGASASGNVALFQAFHLLRSGQANVCLCVGALADYSPFDLQAFANLGAMSPDPQCLPFDNRRNGFVYGQGTACLILETRPNAEARGFTPLAQLAGISLNLSGTLSTEPDVEAEAIAMRRALDAAQLTASDVTYVNAHGTASRAGDIAEVAALREVFSNSDSPIINSTKALTGHTLYAAGIVEAVATIVQMREGFIHPNPFLEQPMDTHLNFAQRQAQSAIIPAALSNSFGFSGIHSAAVFRI